MLDDFEFGVCRERLVGLPETTSTGVVGEYWDCSSSGGIQICKLPGDSAELGGEIAKMPEAAETFAVVETVKVTAGDLETDSLPSVDAGEAFGGVVTVDDA